MSEALIASEALNRWRDHPALSLQEAAWLAGLAPEVLVHVLDAAGILPAGGVAEPRLVKVPELIRAAFALLGQREAQNALLRVQLDKALERERDLGQSLREKLGPMPGQPMAPTPLVSPPVPPAPVLSRPPLKTSTVTPLIGKSGKGQKKKGK
ncbi:MAG: hypothetical protein HQL56_02820 [Magnetococcales bacterium]|nr:hypothetical protein [Magnetococcales bacterium]